MVFAHADTRRGTRHHDAGPWTCRPLRLRPRQPAPRNIAPRRRAADLQATAPPPTPTRAKHLAGLYIVSLRALARRRAPKKTSHVAGLQISLHFAPLPTPTAQKMSPRAPAPLARADTCGGTPRGDAGLQKSRPRRQSARKMSRKPSLGLPHQQQVSNVQRTLGATMKKPFAWVSQGALGTSLARSGAPDCLARG